MIIDPVQPSPYKVIRANSCVDLPDSLGGKKYKGFAFIEGQIVDSSLKVINVKVMKLKLIAINQKTYINYYFGSDNVEDIKRMKRFLPFFEEFMNSIDIERVKGVKLNGKNIITLPIKFRGNEIIK